MPLRLPGLPGYSWDSRVANYRDAGGRFVSREKILGLMEQRITHHQDEIGRLARALGDKRISIADWQRGTANQLRLMHTQQAALGRGGWERMTQADWGRVGGNLRGQYKYLDGFAKDIAAGKLSPAQIEARARMYGQSGRAAYWRGARAAKAAAGYTEERRIAVGDANTCETCDNLEALGWRPLGELPMPGTACEGLTNCRCEMEYR